MNKNVHKMAEKKYNNKIPINKLLTKFIYCFMQ